MAQVNLLINGLPPACEDAVRRICDPWQRLTS